MCFFSIQNVELKSFWKTIKEALDFLFLKFIFSCLLLLFLPFIPQMSSLLQRKVDFSCFYAYGYVFYVVLNHKKAFCTFVVVLNDSLSLSLTLFLTHSLLLCVPMFLNLYHQRHLSLSLSTKVKLNFIFINLI